MTHSHTHEMGASALALAFWLSLAFALVELIGGVVTSSLAWTDIRTDPTISKREIRSAPKSENRL